MTTEVLCLCAQAALEDPVKAAERFLKDVGEGDKDIVMQFLSMANWPEKYIRSFAYRNQRMLIEMKWGKFWFVPDGLVGVERDFPSVGPKGLKALARGLVNVLTR